MPRHITVVPIVLEPSLWPEYNRKHIQKRIKQRSITMQDLDLIKQWSRTRPHVRPNEAWYKEFPRFALMGYGEFPSTIVTSAMERRNGRKLADKPKLLLTGGFADHYRETIMSEKKISRLLQPKVANDRDIAHEQISTSTDEQLAARLAEIEAYGKRTAINGLVGYHDDLRNELQGIKSEQYARANGLKTEPHVRYSVSRQAAEGVTEEAPQNPTDKVLDFVAQNHTQVSKSEKEVPENFSDLRPVEVPIDPGYLFVPDSLSGSRTNKDSVNIGNNRVFLKRYEDSEGVFPLTGDHGSFGVAIRISAITGDMLEDLKGMIENYPALDDEATSQAEHEQIDEAWGDWAHYDFIIALGNHLPGEEERIDALDDDQARELFDRARRRLGAEWVQDSTGLFIDVVPIAEAVKPDDFDEPVAASPKEASVPMQNPEDIAISLGATLDEDTKEWLAGSLANDENSSDDELRELYAANGLSAKQIDMALSIRQWFETDFGAHL